MSDFADPPDDPDEQLGQIQGPATLPSNVPDGKTAEERLEYTQAALSDEVSRSRDMADALLKEVQTQRNSLKRDCSRLQKEINNLKPSYAVLQYQYESLREKHTLADWLIGLGASSFGVYGIIPTTAAKVGFFAAGLVFSGCGYYFKYFAAKTPPASQ